MPTVNWGSGSLTAAGAQRVYVRQTWAAAWSLQSQIWCNELSWSLLPSMPVAQLEMDYGRVLPHGTSTWANQSPINLGGWYVRIEVDCQDGTLVWVGFIDESVNEQGGITGSLPSGKQRWVAYGMPQILAYEYMTRSRWNDEPGSVQRWSGSSIAFNQGGRPNRTEDVVEDDEDFASCHVFQPSSEKNRGLTFPTLPWTPAKYWTTRTIVDYLEAYHMPRNQVDGVSIPFRIDGKSFLPTWDKPTIETEGKPVLSILQELINPSRLLQLSTLVDQTTTPHTVVLKIHSLASSALSLPDSQTHAANTDTLTIAASAAQDTRVTLQSSETAIVNQVVVKGAKRQTVATLKITGAEEDADEEGLVEGWEESEEEEYNEAASLATGYSAKSDDEKREANQIVRSRAKLNDVFRTFVINPEWNFIEDENPGIYTYYLFNPGTDREERYYPWWDDITIAANLPFRDAVDYGTIPVPDDDAKKEFRTPYILFQKPSSSPVSYLQAEKMSNREANPAFSVEVGLSKGNQGVTFDVSGAEQHAIAHTRFSSLPVDFTDGGDWDYFDCLCTVALTEDRFAEYAFPPVDSLPTRDMIRKKVIYAGEAYKLIKVSSTTVFDVDADGDVKYSAFGYINDDLDRLESIGQIAASWFLIPRRILRLVSARPSAAPAVGQLVDVINAGTAHEATINSVVSEIRLSTPRAETLTAGSYSLVTSLGEINPLAFDPQLPVDVGAV